MDYTYHYDSPLGGITLASDGQNLIGLWFDGQKYFGASLSNAPVEQNLPVFGETARWLDMYFDGKTPDFTPPLMLRSTEFRGAVWRELMNIPFGQTATYGEIARRVAETTGRPASARSIGGAVGRNPISIIIPCHRVLGADGGLTGYAGGVERKLALLKLEGIS